jgi:hypothetical protein
MHTKLPGRVIAGGNHAAPVWVAAHRHGSAAQRRIIAHFHGGIEAVAVHVDNFAHRRCCRLCHDELGSNVAVLARLLQALPMGVPKRVVEQAGLPRGLYANRE